MLKRALEDAIDRMPQDFPKLSLPGDHGFPEPAQPVAEAGKLL